MTPFWIVTVAFAVVLATTVGALIIGDATRPLLHGAVHVVAEDTRDDYGMCILCRREMPDEALEYVVADRPEMWCVDLATCKAWRDEWMEMVT